MSGIASHRKVDGVTIVSFEGDYILDESGFSRVLEQTARHVTVTPGTRMLLDMAAVDHLSSLGIGHLVKTLKKAWRNGGSLKLCRVPAPIEELLVATRLDTLFERHESVEKALESFEQDTQEVESSDRLLLARALRALVAAEEELDRTLEALVGRDARDRVGRGRSSLGSAREEIELVLEDVPIV